MKISRREVTKILLAAAVENWDVAVIGAGVFGAWSAYWLRKAGLHVILLDAYGAANSRSSSGGESRIIRAAYAEDDFYSRWALRSLLQWKEPAARCGQEIFHETGVLTFSDDSTDMVAQSGCYLHPHGVGSANGDAHLHRQCFQQSTDRDSVGHGRRAGNADAK